MPSGRPEASPGLIAALQALVGERVLASDEDVRPFCRDFAGLSTRRPLGVVPVTREEEVCAVLAFLHREGIGTAVRAAGCSSNGAATTDGVLLFNHAGSADISLGEEEASFSARARWSDVVGGLASLGRAVPVLTHFLGTSVGGTLSAGGYGTASGRYGAQSDHVRRLRVVLPRGEPLWCGPGESEELFRAANGGLGRAMFIERAVLATIPVAPLVRLRSASCSGLEALGEALLARLTRGSVADYLWGEAAGEHFLLREGDRVGPLEAFRPAQTGVTLVPAQALGAHEPDVDGLDGGCRVWCDYFVDGDALLPFLRTAEALLLQAPAGFPRVHILPIRPAEHPERRSFLPLPIEQSGPWFGVGVFLSFGTHEQAAIAAARALQRRLLDRCRELGGRPYLCGAHDLREHEEEGFFGEEYRALERLRRRLDPDGLFNRPPARP